MKKHIRHLIDITKVDALLEGFNKSTGFVTAILDLDGNIVSKSGWRPICTEFHRIHPETSKRCTISDTVLANKMEKGEKYHAYKCLNGLMDVAVPLKIDGEHVANLFSGQFFFEKPDGAFFKKQAAAFDFDEKKYLNALSKVPVVSEEKVKITMDFLLIMTEIISDLAIQKLEQAELNQQLKKSEANYKAIFESTGTATIIVDEDTTILMANAECLNKTGYTSAELIGQRWTNYVAKECLQEMLRNHKLRRENPELTPLKYEVKLLNSKGEKREAILNINMIPGTKQSIVAMLDITERKLAEERFRESESRFRKIYEDGANGMVMTSKDFKFLMANRAFCQMTGYQEEELKQLTFAQITHPNDRDADISFAKKMMEGEIDVYRTEKRYVKKNGQTFWAQLSVSPIYDSNGLFLYFVGIIVNVTERKLTELLLNESEKKFRNLFQNHAAVKLIIDPENGNIVEANKSAADFYGWTVKVLKEMNIAQINTLPTNDLKNEIEKVIKLKKTQFEFKHRKADGSLVDVEVFSSSVDIDGKQFLHFIIQDISKRKKAQEELIKNEQLLASVMDTQQELICRFLPDTTLTFVNKAYCKIFGKTESELIGRKFLELVPESEWDDIASKLKSLNNNNPKITYASTAFKSDGSIIITEWTDVAIFSEEGKIVEFQSAGHDITEKIQTAKELLFLAELNELLRRIAVEYLSLPIKEVNAFITKSLGEIGKFIKADRVYIFDYNWQLHTCSNTYEWCEDEIEPQIEYLQDVSLNDIPHWWNPHKQGLPLIIEDVIALDESDVVRQILEPQGIKSLITIPIMDNGNCLGFVGLDYLQNYYNPSKREKDVLFVFANVLVNIRKRTKRNKELLQAKEKAEESDKLKTAFINNISHEIRTPLNGILGFGLIMTNSDLSEKERIEYYEYLEKSGKRLMNTITDYMDMAMLVSNAIKVNKKEFVLKSVFLAVEEETKMLCSEKKLEFKLETPNEFGDITVNSDPELTQKIIEKLLDNAIKFTDEGSITLGYCENPNHIEIFVKDTGIGIEVEKIDLIFEMFKQADVSMTRGHEGSGLGLTIARGIASLLGGTLNVTSNMGAVSTFILSLPFDIEKKVGLEDILLTISQNVRKNLSS